MERTNKKHNDNKQTCAQKKNIFAALNDDSDDSDDSGDSNKIIPDKKTKTNKIIVVDDVKKQTDKIIVVDDVKNQTNDEIPKPYSQSEWQAVTKKNNKNIDDVPEKIFTPEETGENIILNDTYHLWEHLSSNQSWMIDDCQNILDIQNISTMWKFINNMNKMNFKNHDFILMRKGIYPLWEAHENKAGSKYSIRSDINTGYEIAKILITNLCCGTLSPHNISYVNGINMCVKNNWMLIKIMCKGKDDEIKEHLETKLLQKFKNLSIWHQVTEPEYDI